MSSYECVCCRSTNFIKRGRKLNYDIYLCINCEFEFVYPLPSFSEIKNYYNKNRKQSNTAYLITQAIDDLENNPNSPKRDWFDRVLNYSKLICQKDKLDIIEIGSGYGYFIHYANSSGHRASGIEISEEYANLSNSLIKGKILNIQSQMYGKYFSKEKFDLIYMEHVFEHFLNPSIELKRLNSLLNQDGIFFISVPNHKSLLARMFGLKWPWVHPPYHLFHFNVKAFKELFSNNNLEIVDCWTGDYFFRSIYQFYSIDIIVHLFKIVINKLLKTNFRGISYPYKYPKSLFDRLFLLPYWLLLPIIRWSNKHNMGSELIIIARKKEKAND